MTRWSDCRFFRPGDAEPVTVTARSAARAALLRGWGEGDRRHVVRVVDAEGHDLRPSDVDWIGIPGGEPERRVGRPETGRTAQTIVRSTDDEREAWQRAAERAGATIGAWAREALNEAARKAR